MSYVRTAPPPGGFFPVARTTGASLLVQSSPPTFMRMSGGKLLLVQVSDAPFRPELDYPVGPLWCQELFLVP